MRIFTRMERNVIKNRGVEIHHEEIVGNPRMVYGDNKVAVVMINSRGKSHPYLVEAARASIKSQIVDSTFLSFTFFEVQNLDRQHTIGKCWNAAVEAAEDYGFIYFVGDDDTIAPDCIQVHIINFRHYLHYPPAPDKKLAGVTCYMTAAKADGTTIEGAYLPSSPTGMYTRDFLLENPYSEHLKNMVDSTHMLQFQAKGYYMVTLQQYFGYRYTFHPDQVSGEKRAVMPKNLRTHGTSR